LDHGLVAESEDWPTRLLRLKYHTKFPLEFISPEHEAAIRALLA